MVFALTQNSSRQREIIEILFSNGWEFMRGLLTGSKPNKPDLPPPAVLRKILVELGPFYVKFGQLLSTRPDLLPPKYIEALTDLQANVPTVAWPEIEALLQREFSSPLGEIFSKINPEPIAAGSIAQIHRATLGNGDEVALKIQRPGIEKIVDQDISLIKAIAELVALTDFGQDYDVIALAEEFTSAVKAELDFTQEARFTEKLKKNLDQTRWFDPTQIVIPRIYWPITSQKILGLEWLNGVPILEGNLAVHGSDLQATRNKITTLLFRAFFQQFYVDGFFHADPHPGNIFYLDDGRVAIIDCGMVGRLDPRTQKLLTDMLLAIVDLDAKRCSQITLDLSESLNIDNLMRLERDYEKLLRKYYNLNLSQIKFSQVFYEVLQLARNNRIKLPGNLGLYAKSLANLEGVARSFNPEINLIDEFKPLTVDVFRRQLLGDNPLQGLLRIALDLKELTTSSPRQLEVLLDRVTSETIQWNLNVVGLDRLRRSIDDSANRLSFSILVGSLILGAAIISTGTQTVQLTWISNILFTSASFISLWLIISILRSGRLK